MKKILVSNNKGGTGKTTIVFHLTCAAGEKEKVLLIDTDLSQSDAFKWALKVKDDEDIRNFELDKIYNTEFKNVDVALTNDVKFIQKKVRKYDLIVIDSDPDIGAWGKFLQFSDEVLIVFAGHMSIDDAVDVVSACRKEKKKMLGIINKSERMYLGSRVYLEAKKLNIDIFPVFIRKTTSFEKAYKKKTVVWNIAKHYADIKDIFLAILEKL